MTTTASPSPAQGRLRRITAIALVSCLLLPAPALAITAGDVLDKMSREESLGYIGGAVEMAVWVASTRDNNGKKGQCISDWYFGDDSGKNFRSILEIFGRYRDKPAVALINVLLERACGK